ATCSRSAPARALRWRVSSMLASLNAQQLELAMQVRALDAQHLGGPRDVPVVLAQALEDERPLDRLTKGLERQLRLLPQQPTEALVGERQLAVGLLGRAAAGSQLGRHVVELEVAVRQHHHPLDHVAKLADVARPVVARERGQSLGADLLAGQTILFAGLRDEVA